MNNYSDSDWNWEFYEELIEDVNENKSVEPLNILIIKLKKLKVGFGGTSITFMVGAVGVC